MVSTGRYNKSNKKWNSSVMETELVKGNKQEEIKKNKVRNLDALKVKKIWKKDFQVA